MIYIIVLLVFCSTSFAQLGIYDMIVEYEQKCYNDSSLEHTYKDNWSYNCSVQAGNQENGYYWELICNNKEHFTYVHKEPDFAGFREFIKQKYKKYYQVNK